MGLALCHNVPQQAAHAAALTTYVGFRPEANDSLQGAIDYSIRFLNIAIPLMFRARGLKNLKLTDTSFGRNFRAMDYAAGAMQGRKRAVGWVIGFGGPTDWKSSNKWPAFEHYELAHALSRAGVRDYKVIALDKDEDAVEKAARELEAGQLEIPEIHAGVRKRLDVKRIETDMSQYSRRMLGNPPGTGAWLYKIPAGSRERIVIVGPGEEGDVFVNRPSQRPDVITCFNVAKYYDEKKQAELARLLAGELKTNGFIMTSSEPRQVHFVQALREAGLQVGETLLPPGPAPRGANVPLGAIGKLVIAVKKRRVTRS